MVDCTIVLWLGFAQSSCCELYLSLMSSFPFENGGKWEKDKRAMQQRTDEVLVTSSLCISSPLWYSDTEIQCDITFVQRKLQKKCRGSTDRVYTISGRMHTSGRKNHVIAVWHQAVSDSWTAEQSITVVRGKLCWGLTAASAAGLIAWQRASGGLVSREGGWTH